MDKVLKSSEKKCKNFDQNSSFKSFSDENTPKKSKKKRFQKLKDEIILHLLENFFSTEKKSIKLFKSVLSYFSTCSFCKKVGHREKNCWKKSKEKLMIKNNKHSYHQKTSFQKDLKRFKFESKPLTLEHTGKSEVIQNGILCCDKLKEDIESFFISKYPISENILKFSIINLKFIFSNLQTEFG